MLGERAEAPRASIPPTRFDVFAEWQMPSLRISTSNYLPHLPGNLLVAERVPSQTPFPTAKTGSIFLRPSQCREFALFLHLFPQGSPLAVMLDDDYYHLDDWKRSGRHFKILQTMLRNSDAVVVLASSIAESVKDDQPRAIMHVPAMSGGCLEPGPRRNPARRIRIGYAGNAFRKAEFNLVWPAIQRIAAEYGDRIEFLFWGLDGEGLSHLPSHTQWRPYDSDYDRYLSSLPAAEFDILLCPLLENDHYRKAKNVNKYHDAVRAGAVPIFSDTPNYRELPHGYVCLKTSNTTTGWFAAIQHALELGDTGRCRMLNAARLHARLTQTAEALRHRFILVLEAVHFHALTRPYRGQSGKPSVWLANPKSAWGQEALEAMRVELASCGVEVAATSGENAAATLTAPQAGIPRGYFAIGIGKLVSQVNEVPARTVKVLSAAGPGRGFDEVLRSFAMAFLPDIEGLDHEEIAWRCMAAAVLVCAPPRVASRLAAAGFHVVAAADERSAQRFLDGLMPAQWHQSAVAGHIWARERCHPDAVLGRCLADWNAGFPPVARRPKLVHPKIPSCTLRLEAALGPWPTFYRIAAHLRSHARQAASRILRATIRRRPQA